jgi:hypothetical protein
VPKEKQYDNMHYESEGIRKEAVKSCFKVLFWVSPHGNVENQKKQSW